MDLSAFFIKYGDEDSCKAYFKEQREKEHAICKKCASADVRWVEKESRWRCRSCKHPMGLKYGTVMENSNLGYKVWLWALYLMVLTKKGFSALEMQRLLGHGRYEPIWLLMHKIRISMGHRDDRYKLDEFIEMDEGFFEGHRKKDGNPLVNGTVKELDRQVKAIVAVSQKPVKEKKEQKKDKPGDRPKYLKMSVVTGLNKLGVTREAEKMVQRSATVVTDGRRCYAGLEDICKVHEVVVVRDKTEVGKVFPWVHKAISKEETSGAAPPCKGRVHAELPERVLLQVQQEAFWRKAVRQADTRHARKTMVQTIKTK